MIEWSQAEVKGEIFCLNALNTRGNKLKEHLLRAFKATSGPGTMYLHESMEDPNWKDFIITMMKEVTYHMDNGNYSIIPKSQVPTGATILPEVWHIKRKQNIKARYIKKWKALLNIDGSRIKKGIHYDQTYVSVAFWNSILLRLKILSVYKWETVQLDYVLALLQATVKKEPYMKPPKVFELDTKGDTAENVLNPHKNVYVQKYPEECGTNK